MTRTSTKSSLLVMTAAIALVAVGCNNIAPADRSGGDVVMLRLATIDGQVNSNGQGYGPEAFVRELRKVSNGRLRVQVATSYDDGSADAETRLVAAIASGKVDGGWPATRAFSAAGIHGLEAVEAPMMLTSHAALADLVTGPAAATALDGLRGSGVRGLALAEGSLRRPFTSRHALLDPADWKGVSFRAFNSPVQEDTIRALGGAPADVGIPWLDQVKAGSLDGAEFDIAQYAASGDSTEAGNVATNVVLWPKVFVLSLSQRRYDTLSARQRGWVVKAASKARDASVVGTYDDDATVRDLCRRGVVFLEASERQLARLRSSVAPVLAALDENDRTRPLMREVAAIAAKHPDPDVPSVPDGCDSARINPVSNVPSQRAGIPDGVYRVSIPSSTVQAAGAPDGPGFSGIWTLTLRGGTYALTCKPLDAPGHDCGNEVTDNTREAGFLRGKGSTAYFVFDSLLLSRLNGCLLPASPTDPTHCYPIPLVQVSWHLHGSTLTFTALRPAGTAYQLTLLPWHRISG
jgi:TRAP-type C4-dicarboxylate transport system substrate-binding protein